MTEQEFNSRSAAKAPSHRRAPLRRSRSARNPRPSGGPDRHSGQTRHCGSWLQPLRSLGLAFRATELRQPGLRHPVLADPLPEVDQIAWITGQLPLKIAHPAELLPIRFSTHRSTTSSSLWSYICLSKSNPTISLTALAGTTLLAVILSQSFFKIRPRNAFSPAFSRGVVDHTAHGVSALKMTSFGLGFRFFSICTFRPGFAAKPSFLGRDLSTFITLRPACLLAPLTFSGTTIVIYFPFRQTTPSMALRSWAEWGARGTCHTSVDLEVVARHAARRSAL